MNEQLVYDNIEVVSLLNKVDGFDPKQFMRIIKSENQEEQLYLDVKYRKLWFRLKYPTGKIVKSIIQLTDQVAVVEAKIYLDRNDPAENFIANAMAQKWFANDIFGTKFVELAETAAVGRALSDAGFGVQFADIGEESDPNIVDAGIPITKDTGGKLTNNISVTPTQQGNPINNATSAITEQNIKQQSGQNNKTVTSTQNTLGNETVHNTNKTELSKDMPIEQIYSLLTYEDAAKIVVNVGFNKGKTLGQIAVEKPSNLTWYLESYNGPDNILRAAAKRLIDSALQPKAS